MYMYIISKKKIGGYSPYVFYSFIEDVDPDATFLFRTFNAKIGTGENEL